MTVSVRPPALVDPGSPLTGEERARWARHLALPGFGERAQRRLRAARVAVVGAGGLGSPVLSYLAAAGVGELIVVDDDHVEESNLQRQVVHGADDVGRPKVSSVVSALARQAPWTLVRPVVARLNDADADQLLDGADLVVDAADNFPTRYAVADSCSRRGVPEVFGSVLGYDAQVAAFWPPHGPAYRDVFPAPPPIGSIASCETGGVLGAVCGIVGSVMAAETVKLITGTGEPLLGRLLVLDALSMRWRQVRVAARAPSPDSAPVPLPPRRSEPSAPAVAPKDLAQLLSGPDRGTLLLVDVRSRAEHADGMLPGALALPLADLLAEPGQLPSGRRIVTYCRSGPRSEAAAAALVEAGHHDAAWLAGGLLAWPRDLTGPDRQP